MILLVEDERSIAEPLHAFLSAEGFSVRLAATAAEADAAVRQAAPRLVILDWMLPDRPGVDLMRDWRRAGHDFPVILLTARHELIDKVLGLELGADDYLTKPFAARELLARMRARLRATPSGTSAEARDPADEAVTVAGITIDRGAHEVRFRGTLIEMTKIERTLLAFLIENRNKVFSRDELLNRVWGYDAYPTTRTIDTHILRLRNKFGAALFETVRGVGYRFRAPKVDE